MDRINIEWNFGQPDRALLIGVTHIPHILLTVAEDEESEDVEVYNIDVLSIGLLIIKLNIITKCHRVN